jgi:hypothetical protein
MPTIERTLCYDTLDTGSLLVRFHFLSRIQCLALESPWANLVFEFAHIMGDSGAHVFAFLL